MSSHRRALRSGAGRTSLGVATFSGLVLAPFAAAAGTSPAKLPPVNANKPPIRGTSDPGGASPGAGANCRSAMLGRDGAADAASPIGEVSAPTGDALVPEASDATMLVI